MCVCVHGRVFVCVFSCMIVFVRVQFTGEQLGQILYMHTCACIHIYTHTHIHLFVYIYTHAQFTCEQLGLDAESLPCAQKVISAEAKLKGTYNIVEEEEEELSVDDMLADGSSCVASEIATLSRHISSPV